MLGLAEDSTCQQRRYGERGACFPLVLQPRVEGQRAAEVVASHQQDLDELLLHHKAILFRGFKELTTHEDFHQLVVATGYGYMPYIGGAAVRTQLTERVFTANESPSTEKIPFHHELAQTPNPPTHIFFFCESPPEQGGETPLLISNEVYVQLAALHPQTMSEIESQGVRYIRVMPEEDDPTSAIGRGWKSTFQCQSREEAEAALRALGSSWEWLEGGNLKTITAVIPAVRLDKRSQTKSFFNSIVAAYTGWNDSRNRGEHAVVTADGSFLDETFMRDACRVMDEISVAIPWQRGDVFVIDNRTVMHSRRPFSGPRRILAAIARDDVR